MTVPIILYIVALVLSGVALVQSEGKSLVAWAGVALAVGLLWNALA